MAKARIGIVGASGYSGAVAARLLATHPGFELAFCTSDQRAGQKMHRWLGLPSRPAHPAHPAHPASEGALDLAYAPNGDALTLANDVDAVMLATSAEVSAKLAPAILEAGKPVVDLSGAFRLRHADEYPRWYKFTHPRPDLLERAHYGIPELFGLPRKASEPALVANPGCYPTATLIGLAPLLRAGLIEAKGIIVDAKSGVSGAGRQAKEEYSFGEVDEDFRAYRLLAHQHTPEIALGLERMRGAGADGVSLTFTPHLLPVKRGILSTCYARPSQHARPASTEAYAACLQEAYASSPFVDVAGDPAQVTLGDVVGTNRVRVGVVANDDVVIVVASIDNLLKGASGQAVQNLNGLFGYDQTMGLSHLHRSAA